MRHLFFITATALLLTACGQVGPLYLPHEDHPNAQQRETAAEQEQQAGESDSPAPTDPPPPITEVD